MGSKNHEVVPISLISSLSKMKDSLVRLTMSDLARYKLISRESDVKYEGYRLCFGGYDYLALKTLSSRGTVVGVGSQIGVGKESDIYFISNERGEQAVLKIHRLGRTSFRTVKNNRDYLKKRKSASWMYLSRLSAMKEYAFMKILYENEFPVPKPIDQNRHCVVMSWIEGTLFAQVKFLNDVAQVYSDLMDLIVRLAENGLIHGDFNEFNILITPDEDIVLIDFPQMVSVSHSNAKFYFDRDVECIVVWFRKRFAFEGEVPDFDSIEKKGSLDVDVEASGFQKSMLKDLDEYYKNIGNEEENSSGDYQREDGSQFSSEDEETIHFDSE